MTQPFDLGELSRAIDQECDKRGMTQTALSREVGVAASTIRRFRAAEDAEADGVLALIGWLGLPPERFVKCPGSDETLLPPSRDGMIRVDMVLIAEAAGRPTSSTSRTSIQRLVAVAQASGQTVASLTRWSEF